MVYIEYHTELYLQIWIMRKNSALVVKIANTRLTKIFMGLFALAERLPTSATLMYQVYLDRLSAWLQKSRRSRRLGNLIKRHLKDRWSATCLMSRRTTTRESLQSDWGIWMQWQIWLSWFCVFKLDISEERVHLGSFSSNLCRLCPSVHRGIWWSISPLQWNLWTSHKS